MFLRPRPETLVILEALGIHCAPLKSYFLSPQSHLFYKAVCAIYAHTHIYIYTHVRICVCIHIGILFQAVVTGRSATDAKINVYVTLQRTVRSSPEKRELLLSPKQGLPRNILT